MTVQLADIQIRDPFVLPVAEECAYYLFGSTDPNIWGGPGVGFDTYRSADLVTWEGPIEAFRPPAGFWAPGSYWAPEVHRVDGAWYMFATFTGSEGRRGTQVLRASRPEGPYEPWSDGPVTPHDWMCLDGTLHVEGSTRWLVFCHEWVECGDGEVWAVPLDATLQGIVGEATLLFRASEASWSAPLEGFESMSASPPPLHVTDGPFVHRTQAGDLLMLWSSMGRSGYAMGLARSTSGSVLGPWEQDVAPLWGEDGGHGMLFRDFGGQLHMTLHQPNTTPDERAVFVPVEEVDGSLVRA